MRNTIRKYMKQQDAYKILAAFLVLTMVGSVFAYIFIGGRNDQTSETQNQQTNTDKYNPELWTVNQPFNSISDALKLTPPGTVSANFVDLENMPPQMIQWARQDIQLIQQVDSLYQSNTTKMYYASIKNANYSSNDTFLLLSTMYPPKNDFDYIVLPDTNGILQRQDTGAINIMGTPVIYAPTGKMASDVLNIIYSLNATNTSFDRYEGLLNETGIEPYQFVNSNVTFAKQFYMGIGINNGSYERTTVYLDANASTIKKINQLKTNSTQNGFSRYDVEKNGNYTTVRIDSPELYKILMEETD